MSLTTRKGKRAACPACGLSHPTFYYANPVPTKAGYLWLATDRAKKNAQARP